MISVLSFGFLYSSSKSKWQRNIVQRCARFTSDRHTFNIYDADRTPNRFSDASYGGNSDRAWGERNRYPSRWHLHHQHYCKRHRHQHHYHHQQPQDDQMKPFSFPILGDLLRAPCSSWRGSKWNKWEQMANGRKWLTRESKGTRWPTTAMASDQQLLVFTNMSGELVTVHQHVFLFSSESCFRGSFWKLLWTSGQSQFWWY